MVRASAAWSAGKPRSRDATQRRAAVKRVLSLNREKIIMEKKFKMKSNKIQIENPLEMCNKVGDSYIRNHS